MLDSMDVHTYIHTLHPYGSGFVRRRLHFNHTVHTIHCELGDVCDSRRKAEEACAVLHCNPPLAKVGLMYSNDILAISTALFLDSWIP
jgi:hypothetical protein